MKKNLIYTICFFAAIALLFSCSKKIDEAFENPNSPKRVPVENLLPGIIGNFVGNSSAQGSAYGIANDGLYIGRYVQFWATNSTGNQYDQMGGATGASDVLGSVWAMHYYGMGRNLEKMIVWGTEEQKWDYVGVGNVIKAWSWLTLTNVYGEVILKQALDTSRLVFDYDTQAEVYDEVRRLCHLGISYLNRTDGNVSQANLALGDAYFYNGVREKWIKFAYSILARSFNHLTNKSIYNPDSVIYYANLGINSNVDNASAKFQATGLLGTYNFYGPFRNNVGALRQTAFISNLMAGSTGTFFSGVTDPRIAYLLRENTNGTYRGTRPNKGTDTLTTANQPSNFWGSSFATTAPPSNDNACRYIFRNGSPFPILTAAENHFMKAEAYLRKGSAFASQARQSYIDGINASFELLINTPDYHNSVPTTRQISPALQTSYLGNTSIVPPIGSLTRTHIMLQKYIAMYGHGLVETWVDIRRYHYTDLDPATGQQVYFGFVPPSGTDLFTNNNSKLVYRARPRYNSEYLYNVAALSQIGALALDYHTKEQWFSRP